MLDETYIALEVTSLEVSLLASSEIGLERDSLVQRRLAPRRFARGHLALKATSIKVSLLASSEVGLERG